MYTVVGIFILVAVLAVVLSGRGGSPGYTPGDPMHPVPGQPFQSGGIRGLVLIGVALAIAACLILSQVSAPGGSLLP